MQRPGSVTRAQGHGTGRLGSVMCFWGAARDGTGHGDSYALTQANDAARMTPPRARSSPRIRVARRFDSNRRRATGTLMETGQA